MKRLIERCAGLDVHRDTVVACVLISTGAEPDSEIRTFGTMTSDLLALADWLAAWGVTVVGMESTGVYWKPVYYLLEDRFETQLLNASHLRNVPGRKTDVADAVWIAELVCHGLVRASFVPPPPIRELRDLTRYRRAVTDERVRETQRLHKVLEDAGIKLSSVASKVLSVSGRAMMDAMIDGVTDPEQLAQLAKGRLRDKIPQLREALTGRFRPHHALMVTEMLSHIDSLDGTIERIGNQIEEVMAPFASQVELLCTIPGVGQKVAQILIAEIGPDMARFPTAGHLASWAGLCPGNHQSAARHGPGTTRKGSKWLRRALIEAAHAAARTKNSYLRAQYHRIRGRRGPKKAAVAVAHSILVIAWHLLTTNQPYHDLGENYYQQRHNPDTQRNRLVHQLQQLGYQVTIQPTAA